MKIENYYNEIQENVINPLLLVSNSYRYILSLLMKIVLKIFYL